MEYWTRIKNTTPLYSEPSVDSNMLGKLHATYGIKITLELEGFYDVYSPDLNKDGYVLKESVIERGDSDV